METVITFKNENLNTATDDSVWYEINFEFISTIKTSDLLEDTEIDILDIETKQGVIIKDGN